MTCKSNGKTVEKDEEGTGIVICVIAVGSTYITLDLILTALFFVRAVYALFVTVALKMALDAFARTTEKVISRTNDGAVVSQARTIDFVSHVRTVGETVANGKVGDASVGGRTLEVIQRTFIEK